MIFLISNSSKDFCVRSHISFKSSEKWLFLKWFHFLLSELVRGRRYSGNKISQRNLSIDFWSTPIYFNPFLKVYKMILIPMGKRPASSKISRTKFFTISLTFLVIYYSDFRWFWTWVMPIEFMVLTSFFRGSI